MPTKAKSRKMPMPRGEMPRKPMMDEELGQRSKGSMECEPMDVDDMPLGHKGPAKKR